MKTPDKLYAEITYLNRFRFNQVEFNLKKGRDVLVSAGWSFKTDFNEFYDLNIGIIGVNQTYIDRYKELLDDYNGLMHTQGIIWDAAEILREQSLFFEKFGEYIKKFYPGGKVRKILTDPMVVSMQELVDVYKNIPDGHKKTQAQGQV